MKKKVRHGIAAVIFRKHKNKEPEFLILHRIKRWTGWELLKGGKNRKESTLTSLNREIREEIGAKKFKLIGRLPFDLKFKIPKKYTLEIGFTEVNLSAYLVEYNSKIDIHHNEVIEHDKYKWAKFKDAVKFLTYNDTKKELKVAYSFMKKKKIFDIS